MTKTTFILCALPDEFEVPYEWRDRIIYTGVGKLNAAIAAMQLYYSVNVSRIINVGTAGGCGHNKGEVVECGAFFQRDVSPFMDMDRIIRLRPGLTCASGDTFETRLRNDCDVVDMEAYAIAKVCTRRGIDFRCFKYISDVVGSNSLQDWKENINGGQEVFEEKIGELM
jgi:adenosylhomocysteine nucleosidase